MELPNNIQHLIGEKCAEVNNIGMSGASVYLFDDLVLKVQQTSQESENEYKMMSWLENKLPVPKIIEYSKTNKLSYLLMQKCEGELACSDNVMSKPKCLSEALAETIHHFWEVDIADCPIDASLEHKLLQAEYNVVNGLVDTENSEPDTFGKNAFEDPESLLYWLQSNRPNEELVFSHGDLCLPNLFFDNKELSGLIDLGRSGKADKWCDIAICYRSLKHNYGGVFSGIKIAGFDESYFFDALQIMPDRELIRYYLLLDELF